MPFFFLLPMWLVCVATGTVMLFFPSFRRSGIFAITVSTGSTLMALLLSTAWLVVVGRIPHGHTNLLSVLFIAGYLGSIPIGALIGGVLSVLITRKFLPHRPSH